ncbi:MAG: anhydro-N-acetylmuramic acid kinase [Gammaproteobacteria bacterium]
MSPGRASTGADGTHFIGLMSGTSLDAVDAVLVDLNEHRHDVLAHHSQPIPDNLRAAIARLCQPGDIEGDPIDQIGAVDREMGELFADAVAALLAIADIPAARIAAIGSHGQTIRHRPPDGATAHPFTLQIGDPNCIAARTGITTVADFRRRDIALGGQGAPLVPPFHAAAFRHPDRDRAVVNLGGIANVTLLPAEGEVSGFDVGPGNCLLDAWIKRHLDRPYDDGGAWASAFTPDASLLQTLQQHPFFNREPPKSTGREDFNLSWLDAQLRGFPALEPGVVQATLLALTSTTLTLALEKYSTIGEVYFCGGGARNQALLDDLSGRLKPRTVATTAALGLDPQWVEAAAFAWLARETLHGRPGNLPAVTGASWAAVLGAIYPA